MKKSKLLLISWILGALYFIYIVAYTSGAISGTDGAEQAGAALAVTLMFPHIVCVGLATLFNILGWSMNKKGFALTGGILYAVFMVLFPIYFMFVLVQTILSFVGYAKMKKIKTAEI